MFLNSIFKVKRLRQLGNGIRKSENQIEDSNTVFLLHRNISFSGILVSVTSYFKNYNNFTIQVRVLCILLRK